MPTENSKFVFVKTAVVDKDGFIRIIKPISKRKILVRRRKIRIYMNYLREKSWRSTINRVNPLYRTQDFLDKHCDFLSDLAIRNIHTERAMSRLCISDKKEESLPKDSLSEKLIYDISKNFKKKEQLAPSLNTNRKTINLSSESEIDMPDLSSLSLNDASTSLNKSSQETHPMEDYSIGDLSGYLDNILHFPKKMSQMAEMMYT